MSLPCPKDDLAWVQAALKKHGGRITARELEDDRRLRMTEAPRRLRAWLSIEGISRLMTSVVVNTYTHSVTYVAENILKSLKDIIRLSGLDPTKFIGEWESR